MLCQSIDSLSMSNRRGFVRNSIRHPASGQRKRLEAAGISVIYEDGVGGEDWDAFARALRKGDTVAVTSLARVAGTRDGIRAALDDVFRIGCVLVEVDKDRRSDKPEMLYSMVLDAVDELSGDRKAFTPAEARKAANKRWKDQRVERTPKKQAERVWLNWQRYRLISDALASPDMQGWTAREAYRAFGKRGSGLGGRPPKRR